MSIRPPITGTSHTLPFDRLSPGEFERLVLWLAKEEGYTALQHLGLAGNDGGQDVLGENPVDGSLWVFQAKRRDTVTAAELKKEVDKIAASTCRSSTGRVVGAILVMPCAVSLTVRCAVVEHALSKGLQLEFWASTELDNRVKRHERVIAEFFQVTSRILEAVEVREEVADLLFSRMRLKTSDLEYVEAFRQLWPVLSQADGHDETTVRLVWKLVHHVSISQKHKVWQRLALQSDASFRISDLAPLLGETASWFNDPAYRGTDRKTRRMAEDLAKRNRGRSDRKCGCFKRIFIDRVRTVLDRDGELFLRLLEQQSRSQIALYVLVETDLPASVRESPHEVTIVNSVATTFERNAFSTYIVPLDNTDGARDHYEELESRAIPAADYIRHLRQLQKLASEEDK